MDWLVRYRIARYATEGVVKEVYRGGNCRHSSIQNNDCECRTTSKGVGLAYALQPFTNSIKLRTAIPDGPFAIHGFASSIHAVPAMSR